MATKSANDDAKLPMKRGTAKTGTAKRRIRKIFGDIHEVVQMPNLIEVQRESYEQFLRSDKQIDYVSGLEKTLRSVFPIRDFAGTAELDFVDYELEPPKYDTTECRQRGITYAAPMRVTLRLIVFEVDQDTEARSVLDIKEQEVYMGDMPLMTENGTFIVNGTERVIVSQMHRSPGVLFDHDRGKTHSSGKDIVNVRIDRKRKLPVTSLLYGLGLDSEEILHITSTTPSCGSAPRTAGPFRSLRNNGAAPSRPSRWSTQRPAKKCSPPTRRSARVPPTRRKRTASKRCCCRARKSSAATPRAT